ncbi:MAG: putative lipid II flippase FtsW [Proteobacteria bacterium]|nr:putative lipid II flippase FtsW [Pseudomonadota bacterium]
MKAIAKQANSRSTNSYLVIGVDFWLMVSVMCLVTIGIVMVASSSFAIAEKYNHDAFHYLKRHLIFITIGSMLSLIILAMKMDWMEKLSRILMVVAMVLLVLVLIPGIGVEVNGSQRWLNLGIARFQVVEAVKLAMIVYLAGYIVRHKQGVQTRFFGVIKPLMLTVILSTLLLLQPDFGSAVLLLVITLFIIYIGGARYRDLTILGLASASSMTLIAFAEPYRVQRLISFQNPFADPFDGGFQLVQALIAIGSGKFSGIGIGGSVQKLFYLPEAHTDFIFSVYAEEMGFIGVILLITIYLVLISRIFSISKQAYVYGKDFASFACAGIGVWIALQTFLSMGVNLGLLPTKGLTLPFISSGGSAIMMNLLSLAIVMRVSYENRSHNIKAIRKYAEELA